MYYNDLLVVTMSTRSVRLDDEAERALVEIVDHTGMSISDAIKRGLIAYRDIALTTSCKRPADFFSSFDLGEGGYMSAPARQSKTAVRDIIRSKAARGKK